MGIAIAGLTADARSLSRYMRTECLNHKYVYGTSMPTGRLVEGVADKHQQCTQSYVRRPYGVGLLVSGFDKTGPHLFETSPAGTYLEYYAMAIGSRAQSAKTYLEKHYDSLATLEKKELIKHALQALSGCQQGDKELNTKNVTVSIVGEDTPFTVLDESELQPYLDEIEVSADAEMADEGEEGGAAEQ
jgi:20S proteasome subunit alpha 6